MGRAKTSKIYTSYRTIQTFPLCSVLNCLSTAIGTLHLFDKLNRVYGVMVLVWSDYNSSFILKEIVYTMHILCSFSE